MIDPRNREVFSPVIARDGDGRLFLFLGNVDLTSDYFTPRFETDDEYVELPEWMFPEVGKGEQLPAAVSIVSGG